MKQTAWQEHRERVYYEDTDAQGVVYFANYLRFMERGRTEWLRAQGIEQDRLIADRNLCFSLTRSDARFLAPARFNDELIVQTRVSGIAGARIFFEQRVCRDNPARESLCEADCEAACVAADTFRPRRVPADLLTGHDDG